MANVEVIIYGAPAPDAPVVGKFLQLMLADRAYLVFAAQALHRYHNQILAHFLAERGIPHRWHHDERLEVQHAGLRVVGGGRFRAEPRARTLELWDDSQAYGRFDADAVRAQLAVAAHPWRQYAVRIA